MSRRKSLSDDDKAVWRHVAKQVIPIAPRKLPEQVVPLAKKPTKAPMAAPTVIAPFEIGQKSLRTEASPSFRSAPAKTSPNMDKKNFQRLLRGRMDIDLTLDLHGLTAEQARQRLGVAIPRASAAGQRMVLVITGKGKRTHMDEFNRPRSGILRESLPDWLRGPALAPYILQVSQAQQKHGGSGAFYVYLRRRR